MVRTFFRKLLTYLSSSEDSDDDLNEDVEGQCIRKRRKFIRRDHIQGHECLYRDYFAENPVYSANLFRRRFRMSRPLFLRILNEVVANEPYFVQRRDNAGRLGLSSMQKIIASLRMLAYGVTTDFMDEYIDIGESTAMESLKKFCETIVSIFSAEYLRSPNTKDITRLLAIADQRGFPGMLGSIDCMHWKWKNCPTAWKGMYIGHIREPTIILEAVASYDLWIWHAFFGMPGSLNDINVLERSSIFTELEQGCAPPVNYTVNGHDYTMGYYLADGIYPKCQTFVKTIPSPRGDKNKHFAKAQESARKDVERAFGVLQQRFAIIRGPSRMFKAKVLTSIMKACVILHNMIIEDERDDDDNLNIDDDQLDDDLPELSRTHTIEIMDFIQRRLHIRDSLAHHQLQEDLIEHQWLRFSQH
ncbi:putative nuclease HARBI1 isoform X2 [Helianthus annuus]|uniref:putative nuclease HARBI1 isoform X2 n=1 Tax=Helianthus annuus TaxID=4232 RepID=UPI001652CF52|nr:putative nuclease HARBI1 isoform X2 [Helianthus annuus]